MDKSFKTRFPHRRQSSDKQTGKRTRTLPGCAWAQNTLSVICTAIFLHCRPRWPSWDGAEIPQGPLGCGMNGNMVQKMWVLPGLCHEVSLWHQAGDLPFLAGDPLRCGPQPGTRTCPPPSLVSRASLSAITQVMSSLRAHCVSLPSSFHRWPQGHLWEFLPWKTCPKPPHRALSAPPLVLIVPGLYSQACGQSCSCGCQD